MYKEVFNELVKHLEQVCVSRGQNTGLLLGN